MMFVKRPPNLGCKKVRFGWWCSRTPGHDGPCAARPHWWNLSGHWWGRLK